MKLLFGIPEILGDPWCDVINEINWCAGFTEDEILHATLQFVLSGETYYLDEIGEEFEAGGNYLLEYDNLLQYIDVHYDEISREFKIIKPILFLKPINRVMVDPGRTSLLIHFCEAMH